MAEIYPAPFNPPASGELAAGSGKDWTTDEDCVGFYEMLAAGRGDDSCDAADQNNANDIGSSTGTPTYSSSDLPDGFPGTAVAMETDGATEENLIDSALDTAFQLTTFSAGCWVKDHNGEDSGDFHYFGQREFDGTPANDGWFIHRRATVNDDWAETWMNSRVDSAGSPTITENVWDFVAVTHGTNPARIYVDGSEAGSNNLFGTPAGTDQRLTIGNANGQTADLKVTNCWYVEKQLTAAEVCEICSFGFQNDFTTNERVDSCNSCTLP